MKLKVTLFFVVVLITMLLMLRNKLVQDSLVRTDHTIPPQRWEQFMTQHLKSVELDMVKHKNKSSGKSVSRSE